MRLMLEGEDTQPQRIAMLNKKRGKTLDEIHFKEKQISSIDYLRYEMKTVSADWRMNLESHYKF